MPPKKNAANKADDKNKNKSSKVQKFIAQVEHQQKNAGKSKEALAKQKQAEDRARQKEADAAKKAMEAQLFTPQQLVQKVAFGTDPKTVLCVYFKAGTCSKGNKCKFSHDLNVERKAEKVNIYEDARADEKKKEETMDDWDEAKLKDVVNQNAQKQRTTTDIVCKYFVQAIEDRKYGWFWICPNGGDSCMYKHALPPGFVLKKDEKKKSDKDEISLQDFVEVERHKLKPPLTPCTPESFALWKKARLEKKAAEAEAVDKAKAAQRAAGKLSGMSGKDMFDFASELFVDEDEEVEEEWDISRMVAQYRDDEGTEDDVDDGEVSDVETVTAGVEAVAV